MKRPPPGWNKQAFQDSLGIAYDSTFGFRVLNPPSNDLRFDACGPLFKALRIDLTEIEGIDVGTTLVILAAVSFLLTPVPNVTTRELFRMANTRSTAGHVTPISA